MIILKQFKKLLSKLLTDLINLSFSTRLFSKILKQAKIISNLKKGDQQDCKNYRSISLLSSIGKIIEKLVHRQLHGFPEFNNLLYTNQFGFRNFDSTNHTLRRRQLNFLLYGQSEEFFRIGREAKH